ncbi:MAG TPA: MBL fold metallo-hydrolase, partial [Microbacterium sp.]|nr:MBL fold metallo-hydrolase [Microbacterium sp.]
MTRTALALLLATSVSAQDLEIHFLEVGHGNAALVVGPDGTTVLIDGGVTGQGDITILPYMSSLGLTELTYGISTHYHVDHLGGLDEVYDQIGGPAIAFDRGDNQPWMTTQYDEYLVSVAGVRATPTVGQTLALGNGATLEFVCLNGDWSGGSVDPHLFAQGENGSSVGVIIRYGDFDAWIAGDLTGGGEGTADIESLVRFDIGQVEVVLAGHHGSETSSNAAFVDTLDPSLVIYSCGLNNAGGVPDEAVIERWNAPDASRVVWS